MHGKHSKRILLLSIGYIFLISTLLSACTPKRTEPQTRSSSIVQTVKYSTDGEKGYRFDPAITITSFRYYSPGIRFSSGEDIDKNIWTDAYTDLLGINLANKFSTTSKQSFYSQINELIASNTLPDVMSVPRTIYFRMLDANRLSDLTPYYEKYASKSIKASFEGFDSGLLKETCTVRNKLYSIAPPPSKAGDLLWIRNDWLNNLRMNWPKNTTDIARVIKMFCTSGKINNDQKKTYGLALDKDLTLLNGYANANHVYSNIWIKDYQGGLMRGETDYNWLPVLSDLRELYANKYIDPNFDKKTFEDLNNDFAQQTLGLVFGPYDLPDTTISSSVEVNEDAQWKCSLIPSQLGPAKVQFNENIDEFFCVNANSSYPESLLLMLNLWPELAQSSDRSFSKYVSLHDRFGNTYESFDYPPFAFSKSINDPLGMNRDIIQAKDLNKNTSLNNQQLYIYNRIKTWEKSKAPYAWKTWAIFNPSGSLNTEKKIMNKQYYTMNQTGCMYLPTWQIFGTDLENKCKEYFTKIIKGSYNSVDEGFREWMKYFNKNGGPEATDEANAWYETNQSRMMKIERKK